LGVELAPGSEIAGYRIEGVIGRGGMGVVYLAEQRSLNRMVALKVVAPELAADEGFRARFVREAQLAASLEHPNIIPIHDAGEDGDTLFISMRYVPGVDLDHRLDEGGALPLEETVDVMRQAGNALDAAHAAGLVHRDVKPANILIASGVGPSPEGRVFLTDFGLTKRLDSRTRLTRTGFFLGTVAYSAPEQLQGREVDGRTDVYSLVCVLYQCLTGALPFQRDTDPAMVAAHLMDPPPAPTALRRELPPALDDLVRRGMAKSPDDRYQTCREVVDELQRAIRRDAAPPAVAAPPPPPRTVAAPPPETPAPPPLPPMPPAADPAPAQDAKPAARVAKPAAAAKPAPAATPASAESEAAAAARAGSPPPPVVAPGPPTTSGRPVAEHLGSQRLLIAGSVLLCLSGLLELLGGRKGVFHVVNQINVAFALATAATGAVAVVAAVRARSGTAFDWGLAGGLTFSYLLIEVSLLLSGPHLFVDGLVDGLVGLAAGALGTLGVARRAHAALGSEPLPVRGPVVTGALVVGVALMLVPMNDAIQASPSIPTVIGIALALAVAGIVPLLWRGAESPGLAIGVGLSMLAVFVPTLLPAIGLERRFVFAPGTLAGLLVVAAGALWARRAASLRQ
jgi:protein kinase-like protein